MKNFLKKIKKDYIFFALLLVYILAISFLSSFRDMINDETLYFHETFLISELFKNGTWIGAYGVGLHGFLSKIPPAIIFLLTGPSVEVVTIYNILLTAGVALLSYKLFSNILKNKTYGILSTAILLSNFHFLTTATTYLREIPAILVILLLLNHIVQKGTKGKFVLGLLFLLLLDAKEYAFAICAVFFVIWLFIESKETNFFRRTWDVIKQSFLIFLPSLIWIILMFTTNIIPVNMFLTTIIGLRDSTFQYLFTHFDIETSTQNALEGGKDMFLIAIEDTWHPVAIFLSQIVNIILSYVGKISYPRVFSFLSIPKVVIFPVVASSIITLKRYVLSKKTERKNLRNYAMLSTLILTWLAIYILRASHGRYLLPIVPAIAVIYVYFLFEQKLTLKQKKIIFIGTVIYVSFGIYFETSYVVPKILLEFGILTLFLTVFLKPYLLHVKYLLISLLVAGSIATAILFSFVQGQIYGSLNFGINRNAKQIAELLPEDGRYWINSSKNHALISALNNETYLNPEWKWRLHEIVPIRDSLKTLGEQQSFTFAVGDMERFIRNVEVYDIQKVVMISTWEDQDSYPYQEFLLEFLSQPWLELEERVELRGMDVYIFNVIQ